MGGGAAHGLPGVMEWQGKVAAAVATVPREAAVVVAGVDGTTTGCQSGEEIIYLLIQGLWGMSPLTRSFGTLLLLLQHTSVSQHTLGESLTWLCPKIWKPRLHHKQWIVLILFWQVKVWVILLQTCRCSGSLESFRILLLSFPLDTSFE